MSDFMAELLKDKGLPGKVVAKPVSAKIETTVESTKWENGEKIKEVTQVKSEKKEVETKFLRDKTMYLSFDAGATISLGNFNMGKVNVSLSMPVGMEITPELVKKIDGTYSFLKKYCETRLEEEVKDLIKMRDS
jgi:hypothetical protein